MLLPVVRLAPYLKVRIVTDERRLVVVQRRALFGLIPMPTRRIVVPFESFGAGRMRLHLRWDSLLAAVTLASSVALLDLPLGAGIPLSILGLYQLLLAVPNAAIRLERLDGRAWTIPICRDYRFDASLAFMDAEQHRDALRAVRSDDPSQRRND